MWKVEIDLDDNLANPADWENAWKLHSFNRRHVNFQDPSSLGLAGIQPDGLPQVQDRVLRDKLKRCLAFWCSYYEHSSCAWFLYGECPAGVEFQWDGVRLAGLLVWEHSDARLPRSHKLRTSDAKYFLARYTAWANGQGYGYLVTDDKGSDIEANFGYLGVELEEQQMVSDIARCLAGRAYEITDRTGQFTTRIAAAIQGSKSSGG